MKFVLGLTTAAMLAVLAGCGRPSADTPATAAAAAAETPGYFVVPAAQLSHIQLAPVATASWQTTMTTTGTVDWDNDHTTQAITQVSGPIARIVTDTGQHVKAGDPLLFVSSPDVTTAIATYRKAKNRLEFQQKNLDRQKDLLDHKAVAASVLEAAQADFNDAATDVQNALQPLKILGISQTDLDDAEHQNMPIRPELPMRAPISGTVVQKLVLPGQVIQAGSTVAFVISDVSTVWIQGHIYERDLTSIHVGDEVEARNPALPVTFHGTVATIDSMVDPATRTTLVRVVTKNTDGLLKKDLFLDIVIHDRTRRQVMALPATAVLYDEQNLPFVYQQVETGKFAKRLVKIGAQREDQIEILEGLKAGDQVVSQGSVFLQFANSFGK